MNQFLCYKHEGRNIAINLAGVESISSSDDFKSTVIVMPGNEDITYICPHPISLVMKIIGDAGGYRRTYKDTIQLITCPPK